jgi:hypothetical protein
MSATSQRHDCSSIVCPDGAEDAYFPHLSDRGKFCQCSNGTPYEMPCPAGLHFNPEMNVCDYPQQADAAFERWLAAQG